MHCITLAIISVCCLGAVAVTGLAPAPVPVPVSGQAPPAPNFFLDLKGFVRSVPHKQIEHLIRAYMLNDAGFQSVIREINSMAGYRVRQQLFNQPQVRQFLIWLKQQLALSGGSLDVFEDLEFEVKLLNKYPHWAQSVNGVAGFEQEFRYIYPAQMLRKLLETTAQKNPIFGEFWNRLVALKPIYERVLKTPQATAFVGRLRALGVDVNGLDELIRYQLGWSNATLPEFDNYDYQYNDFGIII